MPELDRILRLIRQGQRLSPELVPALQGRIEGERERVPETRLAVVHATPELDRQKKQVVLLGWLQPPLQHRLDPLLNGSHRLIEARHPGLRSGSEVFRQHQAMDAVGRIRAGKVRFQLPVFHPAERDRLRGPPHDSPDASIQQSPLHLHPGPGLGFVAQVLAQFLGVVGQRRTLLFRKPELTHARPCPFPGSFNATRCKARER